eukprot:2310537-Amphidinium_carterae.1
MAIQRGSTCGLNKSDTNHAPAIVIPLAVTTRVAKSFETGARCQSKSLACLCRCVRWYYRDSSDATTASKFNGECSQHHVIVATLVGNEKFMLCVRQRTSSHARLESLMASFDSLAGSGTRCHKNRALRALLQKPQKDQSMQEGCSAAP